ncbi:MAG: hypothetical protein K0R34_3824 [Herbinix sp.]|nr:hypothetical protein [Herbinix sp.]
MKLYVVINTEKKEVYIAIHSIPYIGINDFIKI